MFKHVRKEHLKATKHTRPAEVVASSLLLPRWHKPIILKVVISFSQAIRRRGIPINLRLYTLQESLLTTTLKFGLCTNGLKLSQLAILLADVGDDGLDLRIGFQSVGSKLPAKAWLFEATERVHGAEYVVAIDPKRKWRHN